MEILGHRFSYGSNHREPHAIDRAIEWFEKGENYLYLAQAYQKRNAQGDLERAFKAIEQAVKAKDPNSSYELALCYLDGRGVGKDENKAKKLLSEYLALKGWQFKREEAAKILATRFPASPPGS